MAGLRDNVSGIGRREKRSPTQAEVTAEIAAAVASIPTNPVAPPAPTNPSTAISDISGLQAALDAANAARVTGDAATLAAAAADTDAEIAAHIAAPDPHAQYLTAAEGAASFDAIGSAAAAQAAAAADATTKADAAKARATHTGTQDMATISDLPTLAHGTYTPTLFNTTNIASSTAFACQYLRVGNTVTVSGQVNIQPTAGSVASLLGMSLPIASNLAGFNQCAGTAVCNAAASLAAAVLGDFTNDRAQIQWVHTADTANRAWGFSFTYRVI